MSIEQRAPWQTLLLYLVLSRQGMSTLALTRTGCCKSTGHAACRYQPRLSDGGPHTEQSFAMRYLCVCSSATSSITLCMTGSKELEDSQRDVASKRRRQSMKKPLAVAQGA